MEQWISGQKIMDKKKIARPGFFNIVTGQDLQPYYKSGRPKPSPEFSEKLSELADLKKQLPILKQRIKRPVNPKDIRQEIIRVRQELAGKDDETELKYVQARKKEIEAELPKPNPYSWRSYCLPDSEEEASEIIDDLINSYFKTADVDEVIGKKLKRPLSDDLNDKKLRPSNKHRIECRKTAEKLWGKNPEITIADMIHKDEINTLFNGRIYNTKTMRNWIKDLCPNRSPGRRPKAKQ